MYAGTFNGAMKEAGVDYTEQFDAGHIMATFKAILRDWVNEGFDPSPRRSRPAPRSAPSRATTSPRSSARASPTRRMPGLPGDSPLRDDMPINRAFADVPQDEPEIVAEPGFEGQLHAFSLFKYLSRSDVTWNPSVTAVCKASLACPTTEEYILPVFHGNDRVEWFIQLSDEIVWDVGDKNTGAPRARVTMKAGDVAAMPADIRHQGYSTKRSMLYVWENVTPGLPQALRERRAVALSGRFLGMKVFVFDLLPYGEHLDHLKDGRRSCRSRCRRRHFKPEVAVRTYDEHLEAWEAMDRLGYDGVGFNEHHTSPYGLMNSPNLMAAAGGAAHASGSSC